MAEYHSWSRLPVRAVVESHPVVTYYVLAFAISWGAILIVVGPDGFVGMTATNPAFPAVGVASLLGPSVAAIFVTAWLEGRVGLRDLWRRVARWRVRAKWYAIALGIGPLVMMASLLALSLSSRAFLPDIFTAEDKAGLVLLGVGTGLIVSGLEELGWSGFATPRLLSDRSVVTVGLIIGVLWGAWHFPLFAGSATASGGVPAAWFLGVMLFSWLVPYRILMVWAYDRTRSVFLTMVMHLPIVVSQYVLGPRDLSGQQRLTSLLAYGAALWLVVAIALIRNRRIPPPERA